MSATARQPIQSEKLLRLTIFLALEGIKVIVFPCKFLP